MSRNPHPLHSNQQNSIFGAAAAIVVFVLALIIAPYYSGGDPASYQRAYDGLAGLSLSEGIKYYSTIVSSREVIHYSITWLTSNLGIDRNLVMAIADALLAYFSMKLFQKWRVSVVVAMTIVLTNFYVLVLYFAAERLKFGFIFFVASLLYIKQYKNFYVLTVLSIFSHIQMLILYMSILFPIIFQIIETFLLKAKLPLKKIIIFLILLLLIWFLGEHLFVAEQLITKYRDASDVTKNDEFGLLRLLIFLFLSLWYSRNRKETILLFVPILIAASIVGSTRINLCGYFVFLAYGLRCRGGLNMGVLVTSIYFAVKSYWFLDNIFRFGDGFYALSNTFN